jgi:hypothetical protein
MLTHAPHTPTTTPDVAARPAIDGACCLGRTCLHWRADGELIEDDLKLVLQRLRKVDPELDRCRAA